MAAESYRRLRERAGLMDRSARGRIALTGGDRASFLQGLLTNDTKALTPGTGCYAAHLTPQGRMVTDMRLFELGDPLLMELPPGLKDPMLARFEQFIFSEDVHLADLSDIWAQLAVYGPEAPAVVARAMARGPEADPDQVAARLARYRPFQHEQAALDEGFAVVAASDETPELGFDLFVPREQAAALREALCGAGAVELGDEVAEILRVEAGRPAFHVDMDEETIPLEAGIQDRAISLTKGCYVGQEVIIRVLHRGHGRVARKLVGLSFAPGDKPARGESLVAGDRELGRITSAVESPRLGHPIALAYLPREFAEPGTVVEAVGGGRHWRAAVTELPFVRPAWAA